MGFLTEGNTFVWDEIWESPVELVRKHGILQFLAIYNRFRNRKGDVLLWGDEIEYIVLHADSQNEATRLNLRGHEILAELAKDEHTTEHPTMLWRPEYGRHMIEGTPGEPYGTRGIIDLLKVESSMQERRKAILASLKPDERVVTITNYPMMGAIEFGPYTEPHFEPGGPVACSNLTPDEIIHPHHRFSTLTKNIRERRGSKVEINVPLFRDRNTTREPLPLHEFSPLPYPKQVPNNIYMDSMAFGMGCCCLQTTLQLANITEARYLYDQLAVLAPVLLSLTAAAPIFRGYLADTDARWNVISSSVDDRTEEERGLKGLKRNKYVINKSRYDSIDCYIGEDARLRPEYNDLNLVYDHEICERLQAAGVDTLLARHISHLFIRDPLVIYRDKLLIDDNAYTDHFENIQSTNWQTVRFKPPPPNSPIGWRVEIRPMEIQLSDFENAAFVVFCILLTRAILKFNLNFYIPISLVDKNLQTAQKRDALRIEKLFFRKNLTDGDLCGRVEDEYELKTVHEIINGKEGSKGLMSYVFQYLDTLNLSTEDHAKMSNYLNFISKRASGELLTPACWIRNFVTTHPDYKSDSVVSHKINNDLMDACFRIGRGDLRPRELFGEFANASL